MRAFPATSYIRLIRVLAFGLESVWVLCTPPIVSFGAMDFRWIFLALFLIASI
jgi:hypothetical protein